jgi:hypothetical protein
MTLSSNSGLRLMESVGLASGSSVRPLTIYIGLGICSRLGLTIGRGQGLALPGWSNLFLISDEWN